MTIVILCIMCFFDWFWQFMNISTILLKYQVKKHDNGCLIAKKFRFFLVKTKLVFFPSHYINAICHLSNKYFIVVTGVRRYWNFGKKKILEYWNTRILKYRNTGILEYWNTEILKNWINIQLLFLYITYYAWFIKGPRIIRNKI